MSYSRIAGIGSCLPEKTLTNHDLEKIVATTDTWIQERSGIKERHIAESHETTVTMAEVAAREALTAAELSAEDLDLIIVATCTPDRMFPSCACLLQSLLGATRAAAFDLSAACAGFVYGMTTADQFIRGGAAKHVLVVGSEVLSRVVDWKDRATCVLFGDGAGAIVLSQSESPGILVSRLYSDGNKGDLLYLSSGLPTPFYPASEDRFISMQGREIFRLAVDRLTESVKELLALADMTIDQLDWVVPHQANLRIINMVTHKLNIPTEKVISTVDVHANTSAASIPLALHQAVKEGRIQRGERLLFEAFGGGLAWGGLILIY